MRAHAWIGAAMLALAGCASAGPEPTVAPEVPEPSASPPVASQDAAPLTDEATPDEATPDEATPDEVESSGPNVADVLGPPTEAEFRAWDRKDPAAEAHLYAWDQQNLGRLLGYVDDLRCFHQAVVAAGEHHRAGKDDDTQWTNTKRQLILGLDAWQKQLFAKEVQSFDESKLLGNLLEAHELLMRAYPMAYDSLDAIEIDRSHAHWTIVEQKIRTYVERIGGRLSERPERCRAPTGG